MNPADEFAYLGFKIFLLIGAGWIYLSTLGKAIESGDVIGGVFVTYIFMLVVWVIKKG